MPGFRLDWFAGATAQLELFSPERNTDVYQLKYTSPFRSTIRAPAQPTPLGPGELRPISDSLDGVARALGLVRDGAAGVAGGAAPPAAGDPGAVATLVRVGDELQTLVLPRYVQADLRVDDLFLEFGVDEKLVGYPWELMHDGEEFICLRHNVGRFVNVTTGSGANGLQRGGIELGTEIPELSVLLISVPQPQARNGGPAFEKLDEAEAETKAIVETLTDITDVRLDLLRQQDATYENVFAALRNHRYHIVHFNGHATFNEQAPGQSALTLFNRDMSTGAVARFFGVNPPVLCFINACETARTPEWASNYNMFGLARAFLETGAYLLGSRWKISDEGAALFGKTLYSKLLREGRPLGQAVTAARRACRAARPDDLAWASYVLYGDPRLQFRRLE